MKCDLRTFMILTGMPFPILCILRDPGCFWRHLAMRGNRGFTLVELLVVLLIVLIVSLVALPVIMPALSHRQVSEAARLLQGT